MYNNFKTGLGLTAVIGGLHGLPIWLYFLRHFGIYLKLNTSFWVLCNLITIYGVAGRMLCMSVEIWIIYKNLKEMVANDILNAKKQHF